MTLNNAIKFPTGEASNKAITTIRKATGLAIADIRERIARGGSLIDADLSDDDSLHAIISLYDALVSIGEKPAFFQGEREVSIDLLKNVEEAHRDTASELGLEQRRYVSQRGARQNTRTEETVTMFVLILPASSRSSPRHRSNERFLAI